MELIAGFKCKTPMIKRVDVVAQNAGIYITFQEIYLEFQCGKKQQEDALFIDNIGKLISN